MAKGIISLKRAMERVELDLRKLMRAQEEFTGVPPDDIKTKLPTFPFPDPESVLEFDKQLKKKNDTGKALRSVLVIIINYIIYNCVVSHNIINHFF